MMPPVGRPNLVSLNTTRNLRQSGSIASTSASMSMPRASRAFVHPVSRPPITNFRNLNTPTAPSAYHPSYYPFPLGRHMWSTRR